MFRLNIVNDNIASALMSTSKLNDSIVWHARLGHHAKAFRFYVIKPNESVSINSIIESKEAIFDENKFSLVPRPSQRSLKDGTEDIDGLVVLEEVTIEVVQQLELELRKNKRNRTPKNFGPEFQLYLIEGTGDEVSDQHSYYFNVEDGPKTFDEEIKSEDVAFWKETITIRMDSVMGNNTWVLADLPPGFKQTSGIDYFDTYTPMARISTIRLLIAMASIHSRIIHQMDVKTAFLYGDLEEEVLYEGHGAEAELLSCIKIKHDLNTSEKLMPNNGQAVSQLEYSRVIGYLMYAMTCTMPDIAFVVGKLSRYTSNPSTQHWQAIQRVLKYLKKTMDYKLTYTGYPSVLEGYTDASWISNTEDNSSTSGWVFLLGGGVISWASKKQTCITGSTMESEFVALAAAGNAATLAKAYSQMYNGNSRHLGVRHNMIHELITNEVISIEFVWSQQNLVDHLTKGLARDLVIKSTEWMGLKSN
ncbi:zinc finger, CCHC-type containing protein [Tanacetum coccineum]|uniref:Zinc finger, CCHC-type containing protein n=1 Tax=Tanacetum coccineum TaxID=301880 RepID=A0ABQ5F5V7_9ASTR